MPLQRAKVIWRGKLLLESRRASVLLRGIVEFTHLPEAPLLLMGSDIIVELSK